ncbi:fimbrial protein [Pantoea sp. MBD-2R]|uniref:fimbrial protein n=1 Tax=Pantoea sp. MBD-2R TaxID=3141540 RepID=UPI0031837B52
MSVNLLIRRLFPILLACSYCFPVAAYDVYIKVTGVLYGNTCTIATESENITIPLGNISTRQFLRTGAVSQIKTPFRIKLEECGPTFKGATITFTGEGDEYDGRYLKTDEGGASGVAISLLDRTGSVIPLNHPTAAYGLTGENSVDMLFYARLIATQLPVTPGNVTATATYTVEYR